jgi:hypothetical protein
MVMSMATHMQAEMRGKTQKEIIHILTISLVVGSINMYWIKILDAPIQATRNNRKVDNYPSVTGPMSSPL